MFEWRILWVVLFESFFDLEKDNLLRWFPSIALRISTAHGFRVQNVRDFPQTKLDNEINAPFLLKEHGDPQFLFHNFNDNNILDNLEIN